MRSDRRDPMCSNCKFRRPRSAHRKFLYPAEVISHLHHVVREEGWLLTIIDLLAERGPFRGRHVVVKIVVAVADVSDPQRRKT